MLNLLPFFALTVTISVESSLGRCTSNVCSALVECTFIGGVSHSGGERRFCAEGDSGHTERILSASELSDEFLPAPRPLARVDGVGALGVPSALARAESMSERRCFERMEGERERSLRVELLGVEDIKKAPIGSEWRRA